MLLLYEDVIAAKSKLKIESPHVLKLSLKFIEINLWRYPALLHWTIGQLLCIWSTAFITTDSALQDMYLTILKKVFRERTISVSESSYITNDNIVINESHVGILLCILSKLELSETKEKELAIWLYPMLFKTCSKVGDIELAFYSRKDVKYFRMWHEYLDDIYAKTETSDNLDSAIKMSYGIFGIQASSLYLNAIVIFTRIIKTKKHWLSNIFNIFLTMMKKKKFDDVLKILVISVMPNLSVILFFKLMTDYSNIDPSVLQLLLNKCKLNSCEDLTIRRLGKIINDQLNVLKWVSTNIKIELNEKNTLITKICTELNCSTVLSMLIKFIDLNDKNFEEVKDLLIDCDDSIVIYQSYCAIMNALKAILLCDSYSTELENIAKLCSQMEKTLITLFPLSVRLETIENIFSMIFIRHEDFFEPVSVSDCNGEDEQLEEKNDLTIINENLSKKIPGFICNKFALRLIISHLNRCIFITNNELKLVEDNIQIRETRISSLQRYLNEAIWQLELLTNSKFSKIISLSSFVNSGNNFYKPYDESSDDNEIKSDIDLSSESGSLNDKTDNYSGKRSKQLKVNNSLGEMNGNNFRHSNKSVLNYMLATQETLVLRCLWKNDYVEAQRVIEVNYC